MPVCARGSSVAGHTRSLLEVPHSAAAPAHTFSLLSRLPSPCQLASICLSTEQEQQSLQSQTAALAAQLESARQEAEAAKSLAAQLEEARAAAAQVRWLCVLHGRPARRCSAREASPQACMLARPSASSLM